MFVLEEVEGALDRLRSLRGASGALRSVTIAVF
jgi:hypothetical protein